MLKFGRNYQLTIEDANFQTIVITGEPNKPAITLEFFINRDINSSVNTANITLVNLGLEKRLRIYQDAYVTNKKRRVELKAGYGGVYATIFKGNVNMAQTSKQEGSTELMTEIVGFDGGFAMVNSYTSATVEKGISQTEIIRRLTRDLLDTPVGKISEFPGTALRGRSFLGATVDFLKRETNNHFFIDNEKVYCLTNNDCISGSIYLISSETGLLGSPGKQGNIATAEILFEPRLEIGQICELKSTVNPQMNGIYKVIGIQHRGTISGAMGGKCVTTVKLFASKQLRVI